jgi:hypothetical protein
VTPVKLVSHIQACLTPDLLKPDQRSKLTGIHPTEGHCAVAAEAAYHLLGGKAAGWVPVVLPRVVLGDNTHWWIENTRTGLRVDPTAEQFGNGPIPYQLGKPCGFMCPNKGQPSRRAAVLIQRVKERIRGEHLH